MAKAKLEVDVDVTGEEDLRGLADSLEDVEGEGRRAGKSLADLNEIGSRLSSLGGSLSSIGGTLTAAITLPIIGIGAAALKLGADAVESDNLVAESFGNMTDNVTAWSRDLSDALGLNQFELRKQAASFNLLAENMGAPQDAAVATSKRLTELSADLESFLNIDSATVTQALQSGLVGNSEALRSLNIFVNDATLRQVAYENGITETNRELGQQEKFQATLIAIYQQTSKAQGDLARTMESPVNQMRIFGTRILEATTALGASLIPVFQQVIPLIDSLVSGVESAVEFFSGLPAPVQTAVVAVAALAAAVGPLLLILGGFVTFAGSVATAMGTLGITTAALTGSLAAAGAYISGTLIPLFVSLLPILAAVAVGIALGGAVGLAIAEFLEWAGVIESTADAAARLVDEMGPSEQDISAMAEASRIAGREITDWNEAIGILNANNETLRNGTGATAEATKDFSATAADAAAKLAELDAAQKAAQKAAEAHEKTISSLSERLGGAGVTKSANDATEAIRRLGGVSEVSASGISSLSGLIDKLRQDSARLSPELARVALELDKIALAKGLDNLDFSAPEISADQFNGALDEMSAQFGEVSVAGLETVRGIGDGFSEATPKVFELNSAMDDVNDILSETRGFMNLFGVEGDSTFGKLVAGASKLFDSFNSILGIGDKILGLFGSKGGLSGLLGGLFGGGGGGGGLGGIAGAASGALGIGGATGGAAATGAVGGAGAGITGAISSGASTVIGGISTVLSAIPVAGWIGLAGLGVGLLINNIFGGPSDFERVGQQLGLELGEGVTFGIVNLFNERGGTIGEAIQLSLGEVIKDQVAQGTANFDQLTEKAADTFSFLERGEITATEAQMALNESVAQLLPYLDELGAGGVAQLERLVGASKLFGVEFEGLREVTAFLGAELGEQLPAQVQSGMAAATGNVAQLKDALLDVKGLAGSIDFGGGGKIPGAPNGKIPSFADGGFVPRPTLAIVGDAPGGEFIVPAAQARGSGGAGTNIQVSIDARGNSSIDASRVAESLMSEIAKRLPSNAGGLRQVIVDVQAGRR